MGKEKKLKPGPKVDDNGPKIPRGVGLSGVAWDRAARFAQKAGRSISDWIEHLILKAKE